MENMNFIDEIVSAQLKSGEIDRVVTRFPPEPNGYLHLGNTYAINISWSIARKHGGKFNLRFDDTNPLKEDYEYVNAIVEDFDWLGIDYGASPLFGSDYSEQIYAFALELIGKGKAYVCDLSPEEIREYRGTLTEPGRDSPYRNRSVQENMDLFEQMRAGKFAAGEKVLRAKIDMASPIIILRDPIIYRIIHANHYRTGSKWCIYPMYDFAHPLQDYIEGITHSLCSNEFVNNRNFYEWTLNSLDLPGRLPRQIEFGRLNITGVVTSKRHLRTLVNGGHVEGWDDPRLPTLKGLKRRGYTKESIFAFLNEIGVPRTDSTVDIQMLEHAVRQDLNEKAPAVMAVLDPLKVVITNKNGVEYLEAENHPSTDLGTRTVPFTREIFIERDDFMENPPKNYKRLVPGGEVRLKNGYFLRCNEVIKDDQGRVVELHCTYDPETKSGSDFQARKVKGTIHWVSADLGLDCTAKLFEPLFLSQPDGDNLLDCLNPASMHTAAAKVEPAIVNLMEAGHTHFQFIRQGYFVPDSKLSQSALVFNRVVPLKSSYKPGQ